MKLIKIFAVACLLASTLGACNTGTKKTEDAQAKPVDSELKAFMVGGIYFVNGWGGKKVVDQTAQSNGTKDADLIKSYRDIMILPFKTEDGAGTKSMLASSWDINSKAEMDSTLSQLENHSLKSSYTKAWDFARYVNNACLGYASGYFTEKETKDRVNALLPKVQLAYPTWDAFFSDFKTGRDKWDSEESADKKSYDELAGTITTGDHNIYQLLPLK